ncbi:HAD family hydrolase [Vulgatibacter sp.]|uniref:HAD family hydrolase n=1 Tax=Vulgatibacter sp. TaxID=1971226 RepID=UPI003563CB28
MTNFAKPDPANRFVLRQVLEAARRHGARGIAVFDLDSTLFDNKPRQARILREFGAAHGVPALEACTADHWTSGWDMKPAMRAVGLSDERIEAIAAPAKEFWRERFFTSPYCIDDRPIAGAPAFVRAVWEAGATVAYCTGRHEPMRAGSVESLRLGGFPVPAGERATLIMKPTFEVTDDDFKRMAHARLREMGTVIAAFDNEPIHINDYHRVFPEALAVHLATDHSGREVAVEPSIPAVADFTLP